MNAMSLLDCFELIVSLFTAIGALCTAYFMYPTFSMSALNFKARIVKFRDEDFDPVELKEFKKNKIFLLEIEFGEIHYPMNLKNIELSNSKIPVDCWDPVDNKINLGSLDQLCFGPVKIPVRLDRCDSHQRIYILTQPQGKNEIFEIKVRYGLFRIATAKFRPCKSIFT